MLLEKNTNTIKHKDKIKEKTKNTESKQKNKLLAITAGTFALCLITSYINAESVDNMKKKSENLKQQQDSNNEKITEVQGQVQKDTQNLNELNKEIGKYVANIDELQGKIDSANNQIKEFEGSLQNSAQKYNSAEDLYTTRLRSIYENGIPNVMDVLVTSKGISDFFSKMNVYNSVLDYDKSLIGNIQTEKEYTDNIKKNIENEKLQLDQLSYDKQKSAKELEDAKANKQKKVNELNDSKDRLQAVNKELNAQAEKLDKQVEQEIAAAQARAAAAAAAAAKNNNKGSGGSAAGSITPTDGQFNWPLPGHNLITAGFPRYPDGSKHTGIDIGVGIGTPVYSASSGLVIKSKYYLKGDYDGTYKDGYGNAVWVSDGTYTVIYGHLRYKQVVSDGQYVQKGQLIAYTASTGNSTGAHLHFEIRKNGVAIDPRQFF
ncbi:MAG: peptidoglycan DD-metalloendopeptidase family protein [Clostridia bacterium]